MMKKLNKTVILGLIVTLLLTFCGLAQAQPSDIQGHWAESQINAWVDKGLAQGYPDGSFKPDNTISRAEFISLTNHAFDFTETASSSFSDVAANDWFADEIGKSQAAGYITGYQDGTMRPNQVISRQEVATILAKITKLDTATNHATLDSFKDASDIPAWSQGAIVAVVAKDLMHGYPDQTFRAPKSISRAEAIISLNNLISANIVPTQAAKDYDRAGVFGPASGMETINGNVIISVAGVTLQNCNITGSLTLAQGVGEGNVSLKNVTVLGTTYINGGGANSVTLENCTLPSVTITKAGVRVVASGSTSVSLIKLESGATLLETSITGPGFGTVTLSGIIPSGATITLSGSFSNVNVAAANVFLTATDADITQLDVADKADGCKISLDGKSKVNTLSLNAAVSFTGPGSINSAEINAAGSSFAKEPDKIENPNNYSYSSNNTSGGSGNGSGTGTGDGGGVAPLNLVSSDPENGETGVSRNITIKLTFDRGVVRDHWDTNQNCFTLEDKNGQEVDITVTRADNYEDDTEKRNIYVKPDSALTAGMRYILTISANLQANNDNALGTDETISFTVVSTPSG
ncbi:MAG TPA: S-layer homology domain-containing protein, partial [Syntrophomonas sp.]|nr:S-layer homology domain-containing protein [Syntrophomonas sp.]